MSVRSIFRRIGTAVVVLVMLSGGALVVWNVFGQGPYGDSCHISLGCKSFLCVHHAVSGDSQVISDGRCTKSCDRDEDCGTAAKCVVLGEAARDDLPPFGKPERACLLAR
ncbi:MAG TPA: hypothetical protein VMJ10_24510 [Kofleriaceae bacterium]|nr:hypothetical protein [Kofleriaceae bacterium]